MTRALAWAEIANVGGMPLDSVTKQTNFLVFGQQDARRLKPGEKQSSKLAKTQRLREEGQDIEILAENDWLALMSQSGSQGSRQR